MALTARQYLEATCKEAGFDDAATTAILNGAANSKFASSIDDLLKTKDDYSAQAGRIRAAEQQLVEYKQWYGQASPLYEAAMLELQELKANATTPVDTSKFLTREQFQRELQQSVESMGKGTADVVKTVGRISARHASKYSEEPDFDAIEKIAVDKKLPIEAAYSEWIRPREEERQKTDFAKQLEKAKEDAVKEYASRHQMPVDPRPNNVFGALNRPAPAADAGNVNIDAELMAAFNGISR